MAASAEDLAELDALIAQATALDASGSRAAVPARPTGGSRTSSTALRQPVPAKPAQGDRGAPVASSSGSSARRAGNAPAAAARPVARAAPVQAEELESLELAMERQYSAELAGKVEVRLARVQCCGRRVKANRPLPPNAPRVFPQTLTKALAATKADAQQAHERDAAACRDALEAQRASHAAALQEAYATVQAAAQALSAATVAEARRAADAAAKEAQEEAAALRARVAELEQRIGVLSSAEGRAVEERERVAEVKRLWKGVVDTMRDETDALAVALEEAQAVERRLADEVVVARQSAQRAAEEAVALRASLAAAEESRDAERRQRVTQLAELVQLRAEVQELRRRAAAAGAAAVGPPSPLPSQPAPQQTPPSSTPQMSLTPTRVETPLPPSPPLQSSSSSSGLTPQPQLSAAVLAGPRVAPPVAPGSSGVGASAPAAGAAANAVSSEAPARPSWAASWGGSGAVDSSGRSGGSLLPPAAPPPPVPAPAASFAPPRPSVLQPQQPPLAVASRPSAAAAAAVDVESSHAAHRSFDTAAGQPRAPPGVPSGPGPGVPAAAAGKQHRRAPPPPVAAVAAAAASAPATRPLPLSTTADLTTPLPVHGASGVQVPPDAWVSRSAASRDGVAPTAAVPARKFSLADAMAGATPEFASSSSGGGGGAAPLPGAAAGAPHPWAQSPPSPGSSSPAVHPAAPAPGPHPTKPSPRTLAGPAAAAAALRELPEPADVTARVQQSLRAEQARLAVEDGALQRRVEELRAAAAVLAGERRPLPPQPLPP